MLGASSSQICLCVSMQLEILYIYNMYFIYNLIIYTLRYYRYTQVNGIRGLQISIFSH